jgi:hypothetical protein
VFQYTDICNSNPKDIQKDIILLSPLIHLDKTRTFI